MAEAFFVGFVFGVVSSSIGAIVFTVHYFDRGA